MYVKSFYREVWFGFIYPKFNFKSSDLIQDFLRIGYANNKVRIAGKTKPINIIPLYSQTPGVTTVAPCASAASDGFSQPVINPI